MTERTLLPYENEYSKLQAVAMMLHTCTKKHGDYYVADTYLDYGLNWKWTTIIKGGADSHQVLSPKQWQDIMECETPIELAQCAEGIMNGKYFLD